MKITFISALEIGFKTIDYFLKNSKDHKMQIFTLNKDYSNRSGYCKFNFQNKDVSLFEIDPKKDSEFMKEKVEEFQPDIIFVIGWSFMIPESIFEKAKLGAIGQHPTLLPKHRGNAPIPWTLIHGLEKTGVTFFILEGKPDTGPIVAQKEISVSFEDDASTLYAKITKTTQELLVQLVSDYKKNKVVKIQQNEKLASTWPKRRPKDGIIDWNKSSIELYNWVRGLTHPFPGAFTFFKHRKLFVWKAGLYSDSNLPEQIPGTLIKIDNSLIVQTGNGFLELKVLQFEDELEFSSQDFIRKYNLSEKEKLTNE